MYKLLIIFLFISLPFYAQKSYNFSSIDSLSYNYYINGNWEKLFEISKVAELNNINFKFLQQRVGYAYFLKGDYFSAQYHYEKALKFDEYDVDTRTYLYYCGLFTSNFANARFHANKLTLKNQEAIHFKPFALISLLDFEYNYKANNSNTRSSPNYMRGGVGTNFNSKLNLYQSMSTYSQVIETYSIKQDEYFALMGWTVSPHLVINAAYHYINAQIDSAIYTSNYIGNLGFIKLSSTFNRFDVGFSGSMLNNYSGYTSQIGLQAGVQLPGKANIYLQSSLYTLTDSTSNRIVFSQSIGGLVFKKLWIKGSVTLGNLKNYTDNNGLYVYNSIDPTIFRTALSTFWKLSPNLTLFGNYTYDIKNITNINTNYNQHSFSTGIIWNI
ncbi:MAG: tetratricopeptide repeat protein [Paludibacter sp.]